MRILILKPSSLGDVVNAIPVLRLIKRSDPAASVYWWINVELAPLLEGDRDLDGVIRFDRWHWGSPWRWPEAVQSVRRIRRMGFDVVLDLQGLLRSGLMAWLANGAMTVGVDDPREGAPAFYDVRVSRPERRLHAVDWCLAALGPLGVPIAWDFDWLPIRADVADAVRRRWPIGDDPWLVLQPGARWLNKRWPAEHFGALVRLLTQGRPDLRVAILGGAAERELAEAVRQAAPSRCLNLAGATTLWEMIEWVRLSSMMVTNDTGPMHIAAALGRPVVAVFGPTDPMRTGPYGQVEHVLREALECAPCRRPECRHDPPMECLTRLSPERVAEAVEMRWASSQRAQAHCP